MRSLILMIQFMTRYPIPLEIEFTAERFVRGMKWMPLVGLLVALPAAGALSLLDQVLAQNGARMVYSDGRYNIVPADQALVNGVVPRTGSPG